MGDGLGIDAVGVEVTGADVTVEMNGASVLTKLGELSVGKGEEGDAVGEESVGELVGTPVVGSSVGTATTVGNLDGALVGIANVGVEVVGENVGFEVTTFAGPEVGTGVVSIGSTSVPSTKSTPATLLNRLCTAAVHAEDSISLLIHVTP